MSVELAGKGINYFMGRGGHNKLKINIGNVFGRWTIEKEVAGTPRIFLCQCLCGSKGKVRLGKLTSGWSKSCGCLKIEESKKRFTTHGLSETPEYAIWLGMKQRCCDKNSTTFGRYGAAQNIMVEG